MKRSRENGGKYFVVLDDASGSLRGAKNRLPEWQTVRGDPSLADRYGVRAPAVIVINNGRASVARDVKASEILQSGRRLLPPSRFRALARQQPGDGIDPNKRVSLTCPSCPRPTPTPPGQDGLSSAPPTGPHYDKATPVDPRDENAAENLTEAAREKAKAAAGCQGGGCDKKGIFGIFAELLSKIGEAFSGSSA